MSAGGTWGGPLVRRIAAIIEVGAGSHTLSLLRDPPGVSAVVNPSG